MNGASRTWGGIVVLIAAVWIDAMTLAADPLPLNAAAAAVVDAIRAAAEENAAGPVGLRRSGDELTEHYFRQAAASAGALPKELAPRAFLLGLAIGLDETNSLVGHPILGRMLAGIETPEGRRRRVAALGSPTMRGRNDLAKHFVVSAGLAAMSSPASAEAAGIFKEVRDSQGGTGFSFADYAADLAGIGFAQSVIEGRWKLDEAANGFTVARFMPPVDGLPEGLAQAAFQQEFGSPDDERFRRQRELILQRIAALGEEPR